LLAEHSTTERDRTYPDAVTFWTFFGQVLSEDGSCARAMARAQVWCSASSLPVPSASSARFVAARKALPVEMLQAVNRSLCDQLDHELPVAGHWRGLRDFAGSNVETGEMRGHDQLESYLGEGDVHVGDRIYSSYEVVARDKMRGVEFIGRNHQTRKLDFRRGRKLDPDERVQSWVKPRQQPALSRLSKGGWDALPGEIEMRIVRTKGLDRDGVRQTRYVVTTLLDPVRYPADEVASIYIHRWETELRFRDIKTTMGMELLRTKTPELVHKEALMHMMVYNAIRLLMLKAGNAFWVSHRRISFKGVVQVLGESHVTFAGVMGKPRLEPSAKAALLERIAERVVRERPGRNEPRKKKRRPKNYGWLQKPRHSYFEHFRSDIPPRKILDECA